jgi:transcriptional regulator with XRE-family HTH domain
VFLLNALGKKTAALRKTNNYTIQELANRCNISKLYVAGIEKGRINPSWILLHQSPRP